MSFIAAVLLSAASLFAAAAQSQPARVEPEDLQRLTGARWSGTLTYLDYGRNTKVSIPSELIVTGDAAGGQSWTFEYLYPKEPQANGKKTVALGDGGRALADQTVVGREVLPGGALKIVTEADGTDNDKPARFRFTYLAGPKSFSIKKEVRPEGSAEFFQRNEYSWTR